MGSLHQHKISHSPIITPHIRSNSLSVGPQPQLESDPLKQYVQELPLSVLNPSRPVARAIARGANATTHGAKTLAEFAALKKRELEGNLHPDEAEYFRYGTPITRRVEQKLAALDHGELAATFRSGMAAIDCLVDAIIPLSTETSHMIIGSEGYRQTGTILDRYVRRGLLELSIIPMDGFNDLQHLIKSNTKAIFFETPSNPYLKVIDVARVAQQVKDAGSDALVIVDHTFANPYNQKPLLQGADIVVPSLTKYVGGNNQVAAGAVIGRADVVGKVLELRGQTGTIAGDPDCIGVEIGLETLEERTRQNNSNGLHVANILARHPLVREVWHPGHPSHPDYEVAQRQMLGGFGGVVSFRIDAQDFYDVEAFVDTFIAASSPETFLAPSFGGNAPLISSVAVVSHFRQSAEERAARGIPDDLIRLSVGTGPAEQLTDALRAAFEALAGRRGAL